MDEKTREKKKGIIEKKDMERVDIDIEIDMMKRLLELKKEKRKKKGVKNECV